ncbi:MAG: class I SAM-dependent methyltransferase [Rubrimonas sp.]|uniref:class I SAM-dependent methyltransferase n=1 Tax=Rubrimonas sp. TaxID=2036015 RepID=UPI002FDDFB8B
MSMAGGHSALMDQVYRRQRHFYDATRKYFLLGRDRLLDELDPPPGARVLEVGCGTGRNLIRAARLHPEARFYGLDISAEMLRTARAKVEAAGLSGRIRLAQADATDFDPQVLFGEAEFERVFFSYTLSMIPDWRGALKQGFAALAPGGRALAVDFGQQGRLPGWFRRLLLGWLALFHVAPRDGLRDGFAEAARAAGAEARFASLHRDYAWLMTAQG